MAEPNLSLQLNTARAHPADTFSRSLEREAAMLPKNRPPSTPGGDDGALLSRIQAGDESAMAALFDRYSRLVYSVAVRVLRDEPTAEDVTQDIFVQIWQKPEALSGAAVSLPASLAMAARNRSMDHLRRRSSTDSIHPVILTADRNLSQDPENASATDKARAAVGSLGLDQRKVLDLAFFDGMSDAEIADMTGEPRATINARTRSALLTLRKALQS